MRRKEDAIYRTEIARTTRSSPKILRLNIQDKMADEKKREREEKTRERDGRDVSDDDGDGKGRLAK